VFRTNGNKQADLAQRAQALKGEHRDWVLSALAVIALRSHLARREKGSHEMHLILKEVVETFSWGEREVSALDLRGYASWGFKERDFLSQVEEVDSILFEALRVFGIAEKVIPCMDIIQSSEDALLAEDAWGECRDWLLKFLP